ncbi:MAG: hypothetical protein LBV00_13025 [Propionibacteriaceae bacterium]|jgi:hypothetical protein|nr:hypothetical protein [Propionibacteriaceae bacterium]
MPSRVNLPGAAELFRPTGEGPATSSGSPAGPVASSVPSEETVGEATASGRVRHEEKITVYVSSDELIALENARLTLRKAGIGVDRGRIVRAAIAAALSDLEEKGSQSDLVTRLGAL